MIKFVISAVNLVEGGPLTILQNCLESLNEYVIKNKGIEAYAIVHDKRLCYYSHINYIEIPWAKKSWLNRIYCEYFYFKKISKQISPDVWLSLHDITPNVYAKVLAVYCHNSTPFYRPALSDIKYNYKEFLFSLFYRYLYQINIQKNSYVIVQQNWLRNSFCQLFSLKKEKVIIAYPNYQGKMEKVVCNKKNDVCTFFYPAYPRTFKNFEVICQACEILERKETIKFKVILTLKGDENKYAKDIYQKYSHLKSICFLGLIPREKVYEIYQKTDCLLFPSKLETWGLPISEFIPFGKPIILSDLPYAYETAAGAKMASFFNPNDAMELVDKMKNVIKGNYSIFSSVKREDVEEPKVASWDLLFKHLLECNHSN